MINLQAGQRLERTALQQPGAKKCSSARSFPAAWPYLVGTQRLCRLMRNEILKMAGDKMTGKLSLLQGENATLKRTRSAEVYNRIGILTSRLALALSRPSRNPVFSRTGDLSI